MQSRISRLFLSSVLTILAAAEVKAEPHNELETVERRLRSAIDAFAELAPHGGYVWWYAEDLSERAGEGEASENQGWVQPPGTPSVGAALLRAHKATGDEHYLDLAEQTANALVATQLESGGWDYKIDFSEAGPREWAYRNQDIPEGVDSEKRRNVTTLDDDNTQSALRYLMDCADALKTAGRDAAAIDETIDFALTRMIEAQYDHGGWPQRFPAARDKYSSYSTFNDGTLADCIDVMLKAWKRTGEKRFKTAALHAGDFIFRVQQPRPSQIWAQQYDHDLKPAWARKFEPPAISANESAGVLRILGNLYLETGEARFLEPMPSAIEWFESNEIAPRAWARFYELETNRPLYFTKDYKLVYTDDDLPTHYSFQGEYGIPGTIEYCRRILAGEIKPRSISSEGEESDKVTPDEIKEKFKTAQTLLDALDESHRWVESGKIQSRTFIRNVSQICNYIEADRSRHGSD